MAEPNKQAAAAQPAVRRVPATHMRPGQKGRIVEITGGCSLAGKLDALGIRPGKEITKISGQLMRGPVLFQHGNTRIAIGFGMASRVLVEIAEKDRS
jgi:ferrous iron transport protein A